jgi:hypothetical protein
MIKYLVLIVVLFSSVAANSQSQPTGSPTQMNTGWTQWGYQQSTLGTIVASRDTNWTPRFCFTVVGWANPGVDTAYWMWDCVKWKKLSSAGDIIAPVWGNITGTLSNQTDLQNALNLKFNISDTTNKWVQNIYARNDSLFKFKNGTETFVDFVALFANNGLSKDADTIRLGGILNQATRISGGGNAYAFQIDSTSSISLFSGLEYVSSGIGSFIQMSDSVMNMGASSATDFTSFVFSPTRIKFTAADGAGSVGDVWTNTGSGYGHWSAGAVTALANSGLSKSGDTIQLGSTNTTNNPLNHDTWINTSTFSFIIQGSRPSGDILEVTNATGGGLRGSGVNSFGVAGTSTNLYGVYGTSTTSHAIQGWTTNGNTAGYFENTASSTNTVTPTLQIKRTTEGTAGAGIGSSIEYYIEKDNGANNTPSHTLRSILTDPANGNEDGQFELYGVNNASLARRFAISSVGQWTWDGYPALTQQTDTTNIKPIGYNTTTGLIQPMANWVGSGGAGTVTQVNTGFGVTGGPITNTGTIVVDTSLIVTQYDLSLQPKVYNVTDPKFGAIGDGKKVFDAAISATTTTLTSATANFTSADVGKAIRVPYAGAAGVDLITTIAAFTNSTTVTLTAAASATVTADTVVWGSDNTTAFQKALDTCHHYGGGKIWVPNGVYMFAGQLRNNVNGTSPNSQIILPATFFGGGGDSTFNYRTSIVIEGETGPEWTPNLLFDDSTVGWRGVILYSLINGTGNAPALFGTKSRLQASDSLNYSAYEFRNLTILVSKNLNGGGPSIGGINCYYCGVSTGDNVMVTIDGSAAKSTRPTNNVAGIITNKIFSETMTRWVNTHVAGFKYGVCVSDHANLDQVEVYFCDKAFVFMHNVETIQANRILAQWNISSLFIPDATIMGLQNSFGASYFKIDNLQIEVWNGDAPASGWYNYTYIVDDAANQGVGELTHLTDEAGCCVNNALFNKNGGTGIITKQLGAYEDNAWVMVNSVDLANRNTGNVGIGVNPTATFHVQKSQAAFTEVRSQNPNAGGQSGFQAVNDGGLNGGIRMRGSAVGAYGAYLDNGTAYYSNATGGMALMLDANADITLSCGSGGPPPVRLRVAGSTGAITFNNAYTFPTANGTDGYVLTAHTGGVATWDAPTGGSGTVTSFAFTDGGGFDGTVTNPTTTPTLSIIPSFSGLVASESSALGAATIGNLLEYNSGTIQFNDAYMTSIPNTQIFLKSRMQRLSFDVADANFTTLSTRQEGFFKLPEITANRTFSMFSGTGVDGVELYIYNLNTSGTFSWSFTGITPEKASDGSSVSAIANGVLYHILGMYDGTNAHWIIVNQ